MLSLSKLVFLTPECSNSSMERGLSIDTNTKEETACLAACITFSNKGNAMVDQQMQECVGYKKKNDWGKDV